MMAFENKANDLVFSLDIGTRTVIGIVGKYAEDGKFKILSTVIKEHDRRNMYDGQIHDIEGVTKIVKEIKSELEEELSVELKKVSIAAAGRSLKTQRVRIDKEVDSTKEIDSTIIETLELEAVQKAQEKIDTNESNKFKYYCVGYSVVNYYLDNSFIDNLEGHRGETIGADVLATFLPQIVIESLYSVINRAGLEVLNITLEPIAAINIAIKENLRLLNLALVDIGAGTSDIAITKDGTIVAYAMASIAGDEITEKLAQTYLLDFDTSEKLKIKLNKENDHQFKDVVGVEHCLSTKEIISDIKEVINRLAREISEKILEFNGKSPDAVFLIGGSSQIPLLEEAIAESLGLPKERVTIKEMNSIENIEGLKEELQGPDIITPIGIALEGLNSNNKNFIEVFINGKKVKVFNTKGIRVADVLVLTGYNPRKLIPESGGDFIYFLNGKKQLIKGEPGEPAKILVNNEKADLNTRLKNTDNIEIIDGSKGREKIVYLKESMPLNSFIIFNGKKLPLIKNVKVNGIAIETDIKLNNGDEVEYTKISKLTELFNNLGLDIYEYNVFLNGNKVVGDCNLAEEDVVTAYKHLNKKKDHTKDIALIINGEEKNFTYDKEDFVFVDIFNYINFDLTKSKGKLVLKVNGRDAKYMESLKDYDKIEIYWEK